MILHGRQQVVEKRAVDRLAVVEAHFFEERRTQAGESRTFILKIALLRMNAFADVYGGGDFQHTDLAGFTIDFNFGSGGGVEPER